MKIFTNPFRTPTHIDLACKRLPEARRTLLDAQGLAEYAQSIIGQKQIEIARLEALIATNAEQQEFARSKVASVSPMRLNDDPMPGRFLKNDDPMLDRFLKTN